MTVPVPTHSASSEARPTAAAGETSLVVHGDGLLWLREHPAQPGTSVITSLPDVSELPALGFAGWRNWFVDAARAVVRWVPEDGVAIFYQSDVIHQGRWIDKAHLVHCAADAEGATLAWHRIVCRAAAGTESWGRAQYSHMLCLTRGAVPALRVASAHVLPSAGKSSWTRGMGQAACRAACSYVREHTSSTVIVDPFCGRGSVLVVARALGFSVLGVELAGKRARVARAALKHAHARAHASAGGRG